MPDIPKLPYIDLTVDIHKMLSAHEAVVQGIKDTASAESSRRQVQHDKMAQSLALTSGKPASYG